MAEKIQIGELVYKITGDSAGLKAALKNVDLQIDSTGKKSKSLGTTLSKIGGLLAGAFAVKQIFSFGNALIDVASDAEETANKFGVVFSEISGQANAAAENLASSFGIARTEAKKLIGDTGDLLAGFGFSQQAALDMSVQVQELAVDLASFTNYAGGAEGASAALTKGLLGEREALKSLGIAISEDLVKQELAKKGKDKLTGAALVQAKAEATLAIAYRQSGNAIGDFARSADSYANVQRRINARMTDLKTELGDELIPSVTQLGLLFLEVSKDGGVLMEAFKGIVKGAAYVVQGLSNLLALLQSASNVGKISGAQSAQKKYLEEQAGLVKQIENNYGALARQMNKTPYEILTEYAKTGNDTAIVLKNRYDAVSKTVIKAGDDIVKLQGDNVKLSEMMSEKTEEEIKKINAAAAARETQKSAAEDVVNSNKKDKAVLSEIEFELEKIKLAQEAWEFSIKSTREAMNTLLSVGGQINSLLSSGAALTDALYEKRLEKIDAQMEAELRAAGVAEETQVEQAQREYDAAVATGDALDMEEKRRALEKAKIIEKFEKKRAEIEYKGALAAWQFQVAQASLGVPIATMQGLITGWGAGWPAGVVLGPLFAALAGSAAALQLAGVIASKPTPPKFAEGGIVPGTSTQGDRVPVLANSGEMILTQEQQKKLLNGGTGQVIHIHNYIAGTAVGDAIYRMTQDGLVKIDKRAVV